MQIFKNFFVFIFNNLQKELKLLSFQRVRFSHKITQIVKKHGQHTHTQSTKKPCKNTIFQFIQNQWFTKNGKLLYI